MIDLFIVVVLGFSVLWGYLRGALYDLLGLGALVVAYVGSAPFGRSLGALLGRQWDMSPGSAYVGGRVLAGFLIYVSLKVCATVANRKFGRTKSGVTRRWNRNLGALGGLLFGLLTCLILLFLMDAVYKALPESSNPLLRAVGRSGFRGAVADHNPADKYLVTDALKLVRKAREDPEALERLAEDERIQQLLNDPAVRAAAEDSELAEAVENRQLDRMLRNESLQKVLSDEELLRKLLSPEVRAAVRDAINPPPGEEEKPGRQPEGTPG